MEYPFYEEISLMMFGFGDCPNPNPETVRLIENILLKQLRTMVQEALKYTDGKSLRGTELVFLLRHNKIKMRRFVKYLYNKQLKAKIQSMNSEVVEIDLSPKPKNELIEFIEFIDETGEFTDLSEIDEVKLEREIRADKISQALDERKYIEFCKARQVSFRNMEKLRFWIDPRKEINFNQTSLHMLAYLAHQTIAEIIDYALLLRMDSKFGNEALTQLSSSYYTTTTFNGQHRFEGASIDYSKIYNTQPPISVAEIREVMRRVYTPQAGHLNFGGKIPETHYLFAL